MFDITSCECATSREVLAEPHDAQIADDADGAEEGERDREADAHLAFRGRVPAFGAARGRLVAPLLSSSNSTLMSTPTSSRNSHCAKSSGIVEPEAPERAGIRIVWWRCPTSAVANRPGTQAAEVGG